ncbi:hypothetical protein BDY17DRAFT_292040 [Neohortaea acidophila]|uniref:Uncharacterized protein n=1 Tax=Neohortaea acidophila TaxID=245834 RepID=A0A6A6Q3Y7_9PEZI|nr:uncharacterized protein BDY17DRAFT_292040 [Neohortaea acidophila]KAF2486749.1 hypothetical protein BDY17DRAFT_292040 [Neohortaea acidophila]
MLRRGTLIVIVTVVCTVLLLLWSPSKWHSYAWPSALGHTNTETVGHGGINPKAWMEGREKGLFREPKVDAKSPYPAGRLKPAGSNYTRTLVVPKMKGEDTSWIQQELGDMLSSGVLDTAIYAMDDDTAPLHPIMNKGHEVMAYLSYIIDFYNSLPDVLVFMHAHRFARHNNLLLEKDSALMLRHLSPERVTREGYMNLRCHWDPGCPDWMRPNDADVKGDRKEQEVMAAAWTELFPGQALPDVLAQPCCAQFAVSRERVQVIPRDRFIALREWVVHTDLDDFLSGRVFEYTWQYIFTSSAFHCPSMSACYCDGYGICFGDAEKFDYYFELEHYRKLYQEELEALQSAAANETTAREHDGNDPGYGRQEMVEVPTVGREEWLTDEILRLKSEMDRSKADALERGRDPAQRARESGRHGREGEGF